MTATLPKSAQPQAQTTPILLERIPAWLGHLIITVGIAIAFIITANMVYAEAAATAAAAEEEFNFQIRQVYRLWAWVFLAGTFVQTAYFGLRKRWAFASVIQISLIVLITVSFALIAQQVDRPTYRVGVFSLIIFTLIQIAFGNISPQANFRKSLIGLLITAAILGFVVWGSIQLVPFLIQLGR